MIELEDVTVDYGRVRAVEDVSLSIDNHEFVTVIGPSGCGKTTLLRVIGGLQDPTSGTVSVDGRQPQELHAEAKIGYVFQQHTLFPWMSALENVTFLRRMAGKDPAPQGAREWLESMGLEGFTDVAPSELSGGMKQRVAIARALHLGAEVLLMDEPFGELDEITRDRLSIEVADVWRQERKTVVFITHSVPEAVFLGDRCVVMADEPGRIIEEFDIDLPRPRDESVYESEAYHDIVADLRSVIYGSAEA